MHVIGHHDEIAKLIAKAFKVPPTIDNDSPATRLAQRARPVPLVEVGVELAVEVLHERALLACVEKTKTVSPLLRVNIVMPKPLEFLALPLLEHALRNGESAMR